MEKPRTNIDWSKHELKIVQNENVLIHHFKKPGTIYQNVKFINTSGILAVTGDFGNWIFCREFHPSSNGYVSDSYWIEKLQTASSQKGEEFDSESTRKEIELGIQSQLKEYGYEGSELRQMKAYYEELLDYVDCDKWEYTSYAYNNMPRFLDAESVPFVEDTKFYLKSIFDAFDRICERLKTTNPEPVPA